MFLILCNSLFPPVVKISPYKSNCGSSAVQT
nr:MAG TPA: hypothetical protein [Caudoviricetes sp.]